MQNHEFTVIATGVDPDAGDLADRFYKAGCHDALVGFQRGVIVVEFSREAESLRHAVISALDAVRKAGATLLRVEPDNLFNVRDIRIMDKAVDVFGSAEAAMAFMDAPALALDGQRPAELMQTAEGAKLVEDHLARLDHCVYT
jgi:putative toxin-antitoxin system antitoxin component (TIGR02293 family)